MQNSIKMKFYKGYKNSREYSQIKTNMFAYKLSAENFFWLSCKCIKFYYMQIWGIKIYVFINKSIVGGLIW